MAAEAARKQKKLSKRRPSSSKRIEYINQSRASPMWVTVTDRYKNEPKPFLVGPGRSVFFTDEDVERNMEETPQFFRSGNLRRASVDENIDIIRVRNDMALIEIEEFVKKADNLEEFTKEIKKLTSINTLGQVVKRCKEENKEWKFIEAVTNLIDELDTEQRNRIS